MKLMRNFRYSLARSSLSLSSLLLLSADSRAEDEEEEEEDAPPSFFPLPPEEPPPPCLVVLGGAAPSDPATASAAAEPPLKRCRLDSLSGAMSNMRLTTDRGLQAGSVSPLPRPPEEKVNSDPSSQGPLVPGS